MLIRDLFKQKNRTLSFEVFPPVREGNLESLFTTIAELKELNPDFISVTYGAGGGTRDKTIEIASRVKNAIGGEALAHLTCVGSSRDDIARILDDMKAQSIENILALRGDPPRGRDTAWVPHPDGLRHANELVELIRSLGSFSVGVAAFPEGHPESVDRDEDARVLALKQQAGAEFAVTQLFFRVEDYERMVDLAGRHGVTMPIVPGIMPVTNVAQIERFAALSGAQFPADLAARFHAVADDPEAVVRLGVDVAAEMSQRLLELGAPGLHFYTLNRSRSTIEVYQALGLGAATG